MGVPMPLYQIQLLQLWLGLQVQSIEECRQSSADELRKLSNTLITENCTSDDAVHALLLFSILEHFGFVEASEFASTKEFLRMVAAGSVDVLDGS